MKPVPFILVVAVFWLFAAPTVAQMEPFRVKAELAPSAPRLVHQGKIVGRKLVQPPADEAGPGIGTGVEMPADDGPLFRFRLSDSISVYLSQYEGLTTGRNLTQPFGETNTMSVWKILPSLWQQGATRDTLSTAAGMFEPEIGLGIAF
ncbi:MAG: hypothetical protein M0P04_09590 [Syntrophales bacterium]|nr:hypothetical protein [Syntrophales bacterium]MDD4338362.1 hypothetical protein [Syntrophales bacterium]HOG08430.1 hypothetical protein [Syntrophales bacterium]HPB69903.1 hypothetical protein [Syntrophales bacterium]HQN25077.1 hypothetical protein [Syntrophales bacterium]